MSENTDTTETTEKPELTKDYLLSLPYPDFVNTLARPPQEIMDDLTLTKVNLLHGAFGLASELLELMLAKPKSDAVNFIEEGGDFVFTTVSSSDLPEPQVQTPDMSIGALIDDLCRASEQLVDKIKRHVFYSKEIEMEPLAQSMSNSLEVMRRIAYAAGSRKLDAMIDANRWKLSSRYDGGYSNEKAINRDTDNERKQLETSLNES